MTDEERKAAREACAGLRLMRSRRTTVGAEMLLIAESGFVTIALTALPAALADSERLARVIEILNEPIPAGLDLGHELEWRTERRERALAALRGK